MTTILNLVVCSLIIACTQRRDFPLSQKSSSFFHDPAPRLDPGPDLPPKGRSLFDHLVYSDLNKTTPKIVPFPISSLTNLFEGVVSPNSGEGPGIKSVIGVMIPFGRSLQRFAAQPNFFAFPRLLIAPISRELSFDSIPLIVSGRLFVAYAEPANQLEVISYNEDLARFEFQIVENYAPGETPIVRYANRTLCTSCHQNQGPIFPVEFWQETNTNKMISALISHHLKSTQYNNFNIRQHFDDDPENGAGESFIFDNVVSDGNRLNAAQYFWKVGFADEGEPAIDRRINVFQALALSELMIPDKSQSKAAQQMITEAWQQRLNNKMPIFDGGFPTTDMTDVLVADKYLNHQDIEKLYYGKIDFLTGEGTDQQTKMKSIEGQLLKKMIGQQSVGVDLGTLRPGEEGTPSQAQDFTDQNFASLAAILWIPRKTWGDLRKLLPEDNASATKVFVDALDRIGGNTKRGKSKIFASGEPLIASDFVRELRTELGLSVPQKICCHGNIDKVPPLKMAALGLLRSQIENNSLRKMFVYCDACHAGPSENIGAPGFLNGKTEGDINANLRNYASKIKQRILGINNSQMPPPQTIQSKNLEQNPNDRSEILKFIEGL